MGVWLYVAVAGVLGLVATSPAFAQLNGDVMLGGLNPLSGNLTVWGEQTSLAMEAGVLDFNRHLADQGEEWRLILSNADSGSDPQTALEQAQSFHDMGIGLILGPMHSDGARHLREYVEQNRMVLLSCCAPAADLAIPGDGLFRLHPDAIKQGAALGSILDHQGIDVAIPIYEAGAYGDAAWRAMADTFAGLGGAVDAGVRHAKNTSDFSHLAEMLAHRVQHNLDARGQNATIAVLAIYDSGSAQVLASAAAHEVLHQVRWFGIENLAGNTTLAGNGTSSAFLENTGYLSVRVAENLNAKHDRVERFVAERLGVRPAPPAYAAYDSVWIMGLSILEAGSANATAVAAVLPRVANDYAGAMGDVRLDTAGDLAAADYDLWAAQDGDWVRVSKYAHRAGEVVPALPHTVTLPALADITGDLSVLGREALAGMALAADDFNRYQQETSGDWRLELDIIDTETDPQRHLEAIRGIGGDIALSCAGSNSLAVSYENIMQRGMAIVSSCSTSAELSLSGDGLFRLYPDDSNIIGLLIHIIQDKSVVMVVREDSWGTTQSSQMSAHLQNHTIITYPPNTQNYAEIVSRVADEVAAYGAADTAVLVLGFAESADILSEAADHDILYGAQWLGSNGNARHPDIISDTKSAEFAEAVSFTAPMNADAAIGARLQKELSYNGTVQMTQEAKTVLRLDEYISNRVPVAYASGPVAYVSIWLTAMALDSTKSVEAEAFRDAFVDTASSYYGITGSTALNEAGDLSAVIYDMWTVQDGQWAFQSRYDSSVGMLLHTDDLRQQELAVLMVESAIAEFEADRAKAISDIHDAGNASFGDGRQDLFVIDNLTSKVVAYGADQSHVGSDYRSFKDSLGVNIGRMIAETATPTGSWAAYDWTSPASGQTVTKLLWAKSYGDFIFGAVVSLT